MALQVNMLQILRPSSQPLFKFGVISDIQYADSPDAWNFQQTKLRRYSNSLKIFEDSVRSWNTANADFSLILGDIIDIRASTTNTQQSCLKTFLNVAAQFKGRNYYCFGNHCLTCFPRVQLKEMMSQQQTQLYYAKEITQASQPLSYYWNPMPDWCFISLDGYDLSIVSSSSKENEQLAQTLIKQYNPNDLSFGSNKWYHNLPPERCMWTPNNGGFSRDLLQWFDDVLRRSHEQLQKVVIFCHEPVYAPGNPISVAWNYQEVLRILRKYDHVILWLAGHDHDGKTWLHCTLSLLLSLTFT